jgi:hypothetical protein
MPVPILPLVALAAQVGKGIYDSAQAGSLNRKSAALNAAIPHEDPGVRSFRDEIRQKRRYAEGGQTRMMGVQRRAAERGAAQTMSNISRTAGGAPGATQQGLLRSQNTMQQGISQAGAGADAMGLQLMGMEGPLVSDVADRTLSLQTYLRDQAGFQGAMRQQSANNAFSGTLGVLSMLDPQVGGGTPKTTPTGVPGAPNLAPPTNMEFGQGQGMFPASSYQQPQQPSTQAPAWWSGELPAWYTPK